LLVNTLAAYEAYYRERAQLWEIQSLTRARVVAGDMKVGARFQQMAAMLTNFSATGKSSGKLKKPSAFPNCFAPDWRAKIHQMRLRIEKERTPAGQEELAIKTGKGGLMDAEFVAQALCLENGWGEPNTLRALERGRQTAKLVDAEKLIENYRLLRRVEGILRRWSYEGEVLLPAEPAPYYRVSIRCGYADVEQFRRALRECRNAIREVYTRVFSS
jgi:glutamate-ammonia-ligase adenylyltransferase